MYRVMADFQGPILGQKLRWLAGINILGIQTARLTSTASTKGKRRRTSCPIPLCCMTNT